MLRTFTLLLALAGVLLGSRQGLGQGFAATPSRWAVPVSGSASWEFSTPGRLSYRYVVGPNWNTMDLNGDGRPDLFVTSVHNGTEPVVLGGAADPHWEVHLGTASGFTPTATRWAVPSGGSRTGGFWNTDDLDNDREWAMNVPRKTLGEQHWVMHDMNRDGRPDLIVYSQGTGTADVVLGGVSAPHWDVYLNTGSGFAPTATRWALPVGGSPTEGFNLYGESADGRAGIQSWTLEDMDGDGRFDLVVTGTGTGSRVVVLGGTTNPYWDVYLNTGTGFAPTATRWAVPTSGAPRWTGFSARDGDSNDTGAPLWFSQDINGDSRLDLVVAMRHNGTQHVLLGGATAPHWDVYLNTGTGYTPTATRFDLPVSIAAVADLGRWIHVAQANAQNPLLRWRFADMNNDGRFDLVVHCLDNGTTHEVLGGVAAPRWDVYLNTGTGFASSARRWTVPVGGSATGGFYGWDGWDENSTSGLSWSVVDMNNDNFPDLVVFDRRNGALPGAPANPYWEVYYGDATGLRPAPPVAYPTIFDQRVTLETADAVGRAYTILDAMGRSRRQGRLTAARQELELSELAAGLYFVRVEGLETVRIVKQ